MCRGGALAAACIACLAAAAPRPPRRLQPPRPLSVAAVAAPRVLQASPRAPPDGCEPPTDCQEVNASESNLCGVQLQSGVCYLVSQELYELSSPSCTLVGPTSGSPAVFVAAGGQSADLGGPSWPIIVTGRVQLTGVRLVTSTLAVIAAELSVCIPLSSSCMNQGGGIYAKTNLAISAKSRVTVAGGCALAGGGGVYVEGAATLTGGSELYISKTRSLLNGGGLWAAALSLDSEARASFRETNATGGDGGGFYVTGSVYLGGNATITVTQAQAGRSGGGFHANELTLVGGSRLEAADTFAVNDGGGFYVAGTARVDQSEVVLRHATSQKNGGGLAAQALVLDGGSLVVSNAAAVAEGGGLHVGSKLSLSNGAALDVSDCFADRCGGFFAPATEVTNGASVKVNSSFANLWGGGFCGDEMSLRQGSTLRLSFTYAKITGAAFGLWSYWGDSLVVESGSSVELSDVRADMGFACYIQSSASLQGNSSLSIGGYSFSAEEQGGSDVGYAGALYVGQQMLVGDNVRLTANWETLGDTLVVDGGMELKKSWLSIEGQPTTATTALRTPVLHLLDGSMLTLNGFKGDTGLRVGPASEWWQLTRNATLLVENGSLVQITNSSTAAALVSLNITLLALGDRAVATLRETNLSHVRVSDCQGQFANVVGVGTAGVVDVNLTLGTSCTLEAASSCPIDVLRFPEENAHIHELTVECANWDAGCELLMGPASRARMQLISGSPHAACPKEASMVEGRTSQCRCAAGWDHGAYPPSSDSIADRGSSEYCTTCTINTQYDADKHICKACPWYAPWSQGQSFHCQPWPMEGQGDQFLRMCLPAAALAVLALWMAVTVSSPLYITDMTWVKDDSLTMHKRGTCCWQHGIVMDDKSDTEGALLLTVQGPLVDFHGIRQFLWRILRYRVEGSGAWGVDYQPDKRNIYMLQAHGDRTVTMAGPGADLHRASSQGRLMVERWRWALTAAVLALSVAVLAPTWAVVVWYDPGHRVGHVFVSILYMVAVWALLAYMAFPLWLRAQERYYCRTPLAELHHTYRRTIRPEPYQGPDPTHPQHAGITAGVLFHTLNHYKSVVLDRNLHYVVGNIVLPLTKPKQVSFATMWGGRTVMYFVSHSWGTIHSEFVKTICSHAQGSAGDAWASQAYWICSFSNNQWDISAALGETVMDSAFARVLRGGLAKGVVMVLDAEVQPLTRVWCLFEMLVSHSENLDIQYATAVGIIGDPRCTSVDVPLAIASRVETLRVAECESSSAEDKRKILGEVMARMGSLEAMDKHIGGLMAASISAGFAHSQKAVTEIVGKLNGTAVGENLTSQGEVVVVAL